MAAHSYSLRSRFSSPISVKASANSPLTKTPIPSPRKAPQPVYLKLEHVIGTTSNTPSGLSCCALNDSYAYCGGSVAVLADINEDGHISRRYYKARPTASAVNPPSSYYESPSTTPTKRRSSILPKRRDSDIFSTPNREWQEDGVGKTWSARERIKTVTCVSLSPDGRVLAVGETGYNPRILLFSTALDAPVDQPLSIMTEHSWGVRCAAFSPDSRWLATLGDVNDGFLFLWSVNTRNGSVRLHATNKCTTNVCHMAWCGKTLITVGTRHVKFWQIPEAEKANPSTRSRLRSLIETPTTPGPQPLLGRNCLLGNMVDSTFTYVVAVNDSCVVVCTDSGHLCLVDIVKTPSEMKQIDIGSESVQAIDFRPQTQRLIWAGGGDMQEVDLANILDNNVLTGQLARTNSRDRGRRCSKRSGLRESLGLDQMAGSGTIAIGCLVNHTICLDTESKLSILKAAPAIGKADDTISASHNEAVRGVQKLPRGSEHGAFFTWSKSGEVRFWNQDANLSKTVRLDLEDLPSEEEPYSNELKVLRYVQNGIFIYGDRFGILKCTQPDWQTAQIVRAHGAELNDICFHETTSIVASCGRDRMVQVFKFLEGKLELLQTSDDHISAVNQLLFSEDGEKLLSCSSDRTIVVREKARRDKTGETIIAFLQTRVITVKASPLSMCLISGQPSNILVSTMDRHISKIDYATGATLSCFKVSDSETEDSVILSSMFTVILDSGTRRESLLVGQSATDKSVRIYDFEKGILLGRDSAHTEGISDLAILDEQGDEEQSNKRKIVTTGQDSTVMVWTVTAVPQLLPTPLTELCQQQSIVSNDQDATPVKASPASLPPLRKVLSKMDIAEFGVTSPMSSSRDPSPARLRRKTSKLALATSAIDEGDESLHSDNQRRSSAEERSIIERRSPSPPRNSMRPIKQRSRTDLRRDWLRRSPSPPPLSAPSTPRHEQRANKARLRRPPSVPTDLRGQALAQQNRRQSVGGANDFGSMGMATEQACRMLKTYRRKLQSSKEELDLEELEEELEAVLRIIHRKGEKVNGTNGFDVSKEDSNETNNGNDDAKLAALMESTSLKD